MKFKYSFLTLFLILTSCTGNQAHKHSYGEWIDIEELGTTETGSVYRECSECHHKEYTIFEHLNFEFGIKDQSEVCLSNDNVQKWLNQEYGYGSSEPYQGKGDIYYPKPATITWSSKEIYSEYMLKIGRNRSLNDAQEFITSSGKVDVPDLFVNTTYYYRIFAYDSNDEFVGSSYLQSFTTAQQPRTITLKGVSNSRDIGGKVTTNGKIIKQGMIYRSANIDSITSQGINDAKVKYGIKTDLDLRNSSEVSFHTSPLGKDVKYINISGCYWTGGNNGLDVQDNWKIRLLPELKTFTVKENYPMLFHCAIGQDRTGSLALVIGGLLGSTPKELGIDYEMSSFSSIVWDDNNPIYVTDKIKYQYMPLFNYISGYGTEEEPFMIKCERFVKQVGLTDAEINTIRDIMWEK